MVNLHLAFMGRYDDGAILKRRYTLDEIFTLNADNDIMMAIESGSLNNFVFFVWWMGKGLGQIRFIHLITTDGLICRL